MQVEVLKPNGTTYRWSPDESGGNVPNGLRFSTKLMEGFERGSCTLRRRIDADYPDLELYDDVTFIGDDGSVAYNGRLADQPRQLDTDGHSIEVQLEGWMSSARDRKFREIYVDRDMSHWQPPSLTRRAAMPVVPVDVDYQSIVAAGTIRFEGITDKSIPAGSRSELVYFGDVPVGKAQYRGTQANATNEDGADFISASDAAMTVSTSHAMTLDDTVRALAVSPAEKYVRIQSRCTTTHTAVGAAAAYSRKFQDIAMYGDHGLALQTTVAGDPDGLYASDIITDITNRFCPMLGVSGIQPTQYAVPHAAWLEQMAPYDAMLQMNAYHQWNLAVWEKRQLTYAPLDLRDWDWDVRTDDPGTTVSLQGDSSDDLCNGVAVTFDDATTGLRTTITPEDNSALADFDPDNPVNAHGLTIWKELELSVPQTPDSAVQIGRVALYEFNAPKAPGTITVTGTVRDKTGAAVPAWKVRAGDTLTLSNHPNDRPRLITETEWNNDDRTMTITVDQEHANKRLDAFLDRVATALQANNVSL